MQFASSPRSNPFATDVKERLSPSTKNTVTECYMDYRVCQLIMNMFIVQHNDYSWTAKPPNYTTGAGLELKSEYSYNSVY